MALNRRGGSSPLQRTPSQDRPAPLFGGRAKPLTLLRRRLVPDATGRADSRWAPRLVLFLFEPAYRRGCFPVGAGFWLAGNAPYWREVRRVLVPFVSNTCSRKRAFEHMFARQEAHRPAGSRRSGSSSSSTSDATATRRPSARSARRSARLAVDRARAPREPRAGRLPQARPHQAARPGAAPRRP